MDNDLNKSNDELRKELLSIRKEFKAGRCQFGKVFLGGLSGVQVYYYEIGYTRVPERVMRMARIWRNFLRSFSTTEK